MRNNRKYTVWILAFVLCLCATALAQDAVMPTSMPVALAQTPGEPSPSPTATPLPVYEDTLAVTLGATDAARMLVPEETHVSMEIANDSDMPIGDIRVCRADGSIAARVGALGGNAGRAYTFEETIVPTDAQLDAGRMVYAIRYTLGYGLPGATEKERFVGIGLYRVPAQPSVEFTRAMPVTVAMPGDEIAIAYRLRNTGNIALTDITLYDAPVGEAGAIDRLEPGERAAFTARVPVTETLISKPTVSYGHPATSERFEYTLSPLAVELAREELELTLEADSMKVAPGATCTLSFKLVNRGTVAYDHLSLRDQTLGDITTLPAYLRPGQSYVFTKVVSIKSTTTFLFTVKGRSESGSLAEASSNPLTVAVNATDEDASIRLDAEEIDAADMPGYARVRVTVWNDGILDIRNVGISEQKRGAVKTLAVVPPGSTVVQATYPAQNGDTFQFLAELQDDAGGRLTVLSNILTVANVAADAVDADATFAPQALAVSYRLIDNPTTFRRMMIGVLAFLAILIGCIVGISIQRRKQRRRMQVQHMRRIRRGMRVTRMAEARERPQTPPEDARDPEKRTVSQDTFHRKPGQAPKRRKEKEE